MIYKKPTFEFNSVFAPYIRDYIELRESLGAKFRVQSGLLRQFEYCMGKTAKTALFRCLKKPTCFSNHTSTKKVCHDRNLRISCYF